MKIAVMGAMESEIAPILAAMGEYQTIEYANNHYYLGEYAGHQLVVAYSKIGKVFSTMTATLMIEKFGAETLIFSGVAGGISPHIKVKDLVVATATAQHDVDITAFGYEYGFIPKSKRFIETDERLRAIALQVAQAQSEALHQGVIATGDQFIYEPHKKVFIQKEFDAIALEMEGGSVNKVCHEMGIPCLLLRAISDTADGGAIDDFPSFVVEAAQRSAKITLGVIKAL